jgi:hypothetical protein
MGKNQRQAEVGLEDNEIDILADEIVEVLLSCASRKGYSKKAYGGKKRLDGGIAKRSANQNLMEIAKLKNRMTASEKKLEKYIKNFNIASIEARSGNEELLIDLQGQIEELRTAMIKLSSKVKKLAGE